MKELVTQLCLIDCDPMDCSLPSSSVYEILQTRTLKWEAISFSRGSSWVKPGSPALQKILYRLSHQGSPPLSVLLLLLLSHFSCVWLCVTPWTVACQARLSMGFSRQQYWSDLPCPPPQDLPHPGTEPGSPALQADSLPLSHQGSPSLYIWLAKKFVWFLSKNKRHIFHFHQDLFWKMYSLTEWILGPTQYMCVCVCVCVYVCVSIYLSIYLSLFLLLFLKFLKVCFQLLFCFPLNIIQ